MDANRHRWPAAIAALATFSVCGARPLAPQTPPPLDLRWAGPLPSPAPRSRTRPAAPLFSMIVPGPAASPGRSAGDPLAHLPLAPAAPTPASAGDLARANDGAARPAAKPARRTPIETAAPPMPIETPAIDEAETVEAPAPEYPRSALRKQQEGTVTLLAEVQADGTVAGCSVESTSGFPLLDQAALSMLPRWRFKVRMVAGSARPFLARVPFRFSITRRDG